MSSSGFAYIGALIYLGIACYWTAPEKPAMFLDAHGSFMVVAGTAIAALLSIPWDYLKRFMGMILTVSRKTKDDSIDCLELLVTAAEKARGNINAVKDVLPQVNDLFLKDALEILIEGYDVEEIEEILHRRVEVQKERENSDAKMFKNLGKYPPAMGLIGTVMGMITLLGSLGQEGAETRVGASMSVAMSATLYGVIVANLVVLPVADNLIFRTQKTTAKRQMIIEGILHIRKGAPVVFVREMLLSHLSPYQREVYNKRVNPSVNAASPAPKAA